MRSLCLALSATVAFADEPPRERAVIASEIPRQETGLEADHATGDWGGLRSKLVDRGVHLYVGYAGEVLGNVSGGLRRGAVYEGLLELGVELNTGQLGLWHHGLFRASSLFPHGSGLTGKYTGDLLTLSNIDGYESFRLYELWYEHRLANFSVRLGQLAADEEFAVTEGGSDFLNSGFGWPAFISGNVLNTGPAYFVAAPGLRMRYDATDLCYLQAGVYDGDSFDSPSGDPRVNARGTRLHFSGDQGILALVEGGVGWNKDRLPGGAKLGAWLHSADFESPFENENGGPIALSGNPPKTHSPNFGFYSALEQTLWREEEDQGLRAFLRAGLAPRDRNMFEFVADLGFAWTGPLPARDQDVLGIGFVHARLSRDIRKHEQLDSAVNGTDYAAYSSHESVLECFYSLHLKKWWIVQPDVQWVFHPGGNAAISDALVLGLRTTLVF